MDSTEGNVQALESCTSGLLVPFVEDEKGRDEIASVVQGGPARHFCARGFSAVAFDRVLKATFPFVV